VTSVAEWRERARTALLELLDRENAVVWPEVEAKLEPRPGFGNRGKGIDPHHLEFARRDLRGRGIIREESTASRGVAPISVVTLAATDRMRTKTATAAVSARKTAAAGPLHGLDPPNSIATQPHRPSWGTLHSKPPSQLACPIDWNSEQLVALLGCSLEMSPCQSGLWMTPLTSQASPRMASRS